MLMYVKKTIVSGIIGIMVTGCTLKVEPVDSRTKAQKMRDEKGSFLNVDGVVKGQKKVNLKDIKLSMGVNLYLWRGALETLSVVPLEKVDAKTGVIQTQWVTINNNPNEQVKMTSVILHEELKVSGLRVAVLKRVRKKGKWVDIAISRRTVRRIEDAILLRARELYTQKHDGE